MKVWTIEEDAILRELFPQGFLVPFIVEELARRAKSRHKIGAVYWRVRRLGLTRADEPDLHAEDKLRPKAPSAAALKWKARYAEILAAEVDLSDRRRPMPDRKLLTPGELEYVVARPPAHRPPNIKAPSDPGFACRVLEAFVMGLPSTEKSGS